MIEPEIPVVVVTGPTASGKTRLAVTLAAQFNGEIVSADSRQVYRGMDIGTGKDLAEYGEIPYHLIDIVNPMDIYHLSAFLKDASDVLRDIAARGKLPVIAGGTPLWIHALICRYDMPGTEPDPEQRRQLYAASASELSDRLRAEFPEIAAHFHDWNNVNRLARAIEIGQASQGSAQTPVDIPRLDPLIIAPYFTRTVIRDRIEKRLDQRLENGMMDEMRHLLERGATYDRLLSFGLEYRFAAQYLLGELSESEMRIRLLNKIHQFAKRQDIWFRKFERENLDIHWIPDADSDVAAALIHLHLAHQPVPAPHFRLNDTVYGPRNPGFYS